MKHATKQSTTRAAAKAAGQKAFFTGEPCIRGHVSVRDTANGGCRQCKSEQRVGQFTPITTKTLVTRLELHRARCRSLIAELRKRLDYIERDHEQHVNETTLESNANGR
jgi:hypothetical protein